MSQPVFPEAAAVIFAAHRRVFVTPEVADRRIGETCLLQALRHRYRFHDDDLLRVDLSFPDAFLKANPSAREISAEQCSSTLDPGEVAFATSVDRVFVVQDDYRHPMVTTYGRFLGAALFLERSGPRPMCDVLNHKMMPSDAASAHLVATHDGWALPVHRDDLETIRSIARRQRNTGAPQARRCEWLDGVIQAASSIIEPDAVRENECQVIQGPWCRT